MNFQTAPLATVKTLLLGNSYKSVDCQPSFKLTHILLIGIQLDMTCLCGSLCNYDLLISKLKSYFHVASPLFYPPPAGLFSSLTHYWKQSTTNFGAFKSRLLFSCNCMVCFKTLPFFSFCELIRIHM